MENIKPVPSELVGKTLQKKAFSFAPNAFGIPMPKNYLDNPDLRLLPYLQERLHTLHEILPRLADDLTQSGTQLKPKELEKIAVQLEHLTRFEILRLNNSDPIIFDLARDVINVAQTLTTLPNATTKTVFLASESSCLSCQNNNFSHQQKTELLSVDIPLVAQVECHPSVRPGQSIGALNSIRSVFNSESVNGKNLTKDDRLKLAKVTLPTLESFLRNKTYLEDFDYKQIIEIIKSSVFRDEFTNPDKASLLPDVFYIFDQLLLMEIGPDTLRSILSFYDFYLQENEITGLIPKVIFKLAPNDPIRESLLNETKQLLSRVANSEDTLRQDSSYIYGLMSAYYRLGNYQLKT